MRALTAHRGVMDSLIAEHRGRIANTAGDSVLAEFPSVVDAVKCAVQVQAAIARNDEAEAEERRLTFRVGVHVGDVIVRGNDIIGDAVNVAARLQSLAEAGGICLSAVAHEYVRNVLPLNFDDLGTQSVKNISEPIRAYAIRAENRNAELPLSTGSRASALTQPDKPSLAVLPFSTTQAEEEYLAEGICDDIITALYKMRWLFVIRELRVPAEGPRYRCDPNRPAARCGLYPERKRTP